MTDGFLLLDRPNPTGDHFYASRLEPMLAIVMHITAGLQDLDTIDDRSAEGVSEYCRTTSTDVSWHSSSDTDSIVYLLPAQYTAWHATSYNSCTYGHEQCKTNTDWRTMPRTWIEKTLRNAAKAVAPIVIKYKIPIRKASRAELDAARAAYRAGKSYAPVGFIAHGALQSDRTDPGYVQGVGDTYPWDEFLGYVDEYVNGGEMIAIFDTTQLPKTEPGEYERMYIPTPWNGKNGIMEGGQVFVTACAADLGMDVRLLHAQVREPGKAYPKIFPAVKIAANMDSGGKKMPDFTRGVVIEYSAPQGGAVAVEAWK